MENEEYIYMLEEKVKSMANAMTTANKNMRAVHIFLVDSLERMKLEETIIYKEDVEPILVSLAKSIKTLNIWGCHE